MGQNELRSVETVKTEDVNLKGWAHPVWGSLHEQLAQLEDGQSILVSPKRGETQRLCASRVSALLCTQYRGKYHSRCTTEGKVAVTRKEKKDVPK